MFLILNRNHFSPTVETFPKIILHSNSYYFKPHKALDLANGFLTKLLNISTVVTDKNLKESKEAFNNKNDHKIYSVTQL